MSNAPRCPKCDAEIMLGNRCVCSVRLLDEMPGVFVCGGSGIKPEARAELIDYRTWLLLPKPRQEFRAWRSAAPGRATPETEE